MSPKRPLFMSWCAMLAAASFSGIPSAMADGSSDAGESPVSVASIVMSASRAQKGTSATATVTVCHADGTPVSGALVTGSWSGLATATGSALTNRHGRATFHSVRTTTPGTFVFDLVTVTAMGAGYDAAHNSTSHETVSVKEPMTTVELTAFKN